MVCAWIGIGHIALILIDGEERSWPFSGVVGVAILILLGGWMNLAGIVHSAELITLVALGDVLFLSWALRSRVRIRQIRSAFLGLPTWSQVLGTCCVLLLLMIGASSLKFAKFSTFDDLPAYLTFPVKLFQLGSLPVDPFSERRVQSGLGANYFLQAFMLVVGDVRSMWFIDAGAGLILFFGCMYRAARRLGNGRSLSLSVAALVIAVPLSHVNLGSTVLPAAMFTAMFLVGVLEGASPMRGCVLIGILGASVSLLKSIYIPPALLIIVSMPLLRLEWSRWLIAVRGALLATLVFAFGLLPWMIDMAHKEGTALYPLLGKGDEISAYEVVPHLIRPGYYPRIIGVAVMIVFMGAALVHYKVSRDLRHAADVSLMLLVGGLVAVPISISVAGSSLLRYISPFELPFCLLLLGSLVACRSGDGTRRTTLWCAYACVGALIMGIEVYGVTHSDFDIYSWPYDHEVTGSVSGTVIFDDAAVRAAREGAGRLQAAIPPGESIYADFMITFPMNFRRNEVYVADFPGMASLPPGMPTRDSPLALRDYLLARSIRFIAYNSQLVRLREEGLSWPMRRSGTWPLVQSLNSVDVDHEIESLAAVCSLIYDDGDNKVIDLLHERVRSARSNPR